MGMGLEGQISRKISEKYLGNPRVPTEGLDLVSDFSVFLTYRDVETDREVRDQDLDHPVRDRDPAETTEGLGNVGTRSGSRLSPGPSLGRVGMVDG